MGKYIVYTVNGVAFVPLHQVKILDRENQELKMANKNLQTMLDMVLMAKGGKGVSSDTGRECDI